MKRHWKRTASVAAVFVAWTVLDFLMGKPYRPEMAMIAGFVVTWTMEPSWEEE